MAFYFKDIILFFQILILKLGQIAMVTIQVVAYQRLAQIFSCHVLVCLNTCRQTCVMSQALLTHLQTLGDGTMVSLHSVLIPFDFSFPFLACSFQRQSQDVVIARLS